MSRTRRLLAWMLSLALILSLAMSVMVYASATEEPTGNTSAEQATQQPTEKPTEQATEAPTEQATEAPTQAPTEQATEAPTQQPTEAPTQAPAAPAEVEPETPADQPAQQAPQQSAKAAAKTVKPAAKAAAKAAAAQGQTEDVKLETVTEAAMNTVIHDHAAEGYTAWSASGPVPVAPGKYYLTENITLGSTWDVVSGVTELCLNGHKITMDSAVDATLIHVGTGATLDITDCQENAGVLADGTASEWTFGSNQKHAGGGVFISGGTFRMHAGKITNNTSSVTGGGIEITSGSLVLDGTASVTGNTAATDSMGADLYVYGGSVILGGTGQLSKVRLNTGAVLGIVSGFNPNPAYKIQVYAETTDVASTNGNPIPYTFTSGFETAVGEGMSVYDYFSSGNSDYQVHAVNGEAALHPIGRDYNLNAEKTVLTSYCKGGSDCSTVPTVSLTLNASGGNYTGSPFSASLENLSAFNAATGLSVSAEDIQYTNTTTGQALTGAPVDAGTYTASLTVEGKTLEKSITINKTEIPAAHIVPPEGKSGLTYTGGKQALYTKGSSQDGTMVYSSTETGTYTTEALVGRKAGTYTLWYKVEGDDNHLSSQPKSFQVRLEKAKATVTAVDQTVVTSGVGFVKDTSGVTVTGLVGSQKLSGITLTGSGFDTATDKGTIEAKDAVIKDGEEDTSKNYTITYTAGKLTVIPRILKKTEGKGVTDLEYTLTDKAVESLVKSLGAQDAYDSGKQVVVTLTVKVLDADKVDSQEKTLITKAMGTGGKVAQYMNLTLSLSINGKTYQLKDLGNEKVTLKMTVPADAQSKSTTSTRTYYLISVHNGAANVLGKGTKTSLSGSSSLFSTYAIGYSDGSSTSTSGSGSKTTGTTADEKTTTSGTTAKTTGTNPKTGDSASTDNWITLCSAAALCLWVLIAQERKDRQNAR